MLAHVLDVLPDEVRRQTGVRLLRPDEPVPPAAWPVHRLVEAHDHHRAAFAGHWAADPAADRRVLASLWTKPLATRLAGLVGAVHALTGGPVPLAGRGPWVSFDPVGRAAAVLLAPAAGGAPTVPASATGPAEGAEGADGAAGQLHRWFTPLVDHLRVEVGLSRTVAWGNVATGAFGVLLELQRAGIPSGVLLERWEQLLAAEPGAPLRRRMTSLRVSVAGHEVAAPRRETCCLKYRLPGRELCLTCNLRPVEEQRTRFTASLVGPADAAGGR